jgi:ATP-dependent protease ClpP protease subunit
MERDFFMSAPEAMEYGIVDQVMTRRKHGAVQK